ncbi:MAG: flagellar hook-associated protein FlgK [Planctomycetaceae bacterium]
MKAFDIGLSALRAQQLTLSVQGNNLANSATPGYHRQVVELASRAPLRNDRFSIGGGVDVSGVRRSYATAIETSLLRNGSEAGYSQQTQEIAKQIESLLTPGEASIHASLSKFFDRMEKVANAPQDRTVRQEFLSSASELMSGFSGLDQNLAALGRDMSLNLNDSVKQVNQYVNEIAQLNSEIFRARTLGITPNELLDRRDQVATQLSEYMEVDNVTTADGHEQTLLAGGTVSIGVLPVTFRVLRDANGTTGIAVNNQPTAISLNSGRLAAMTTALNDTIPEFTSRLRDLSRGIVQAVDQQHAQGISDRGPSTVLQGNRSVINVSLPLARSNPEFAVGYGELSVTMTDTTTGVRRTEKITINPDKDSLEDVATKLSTISGVSASVDGVSKTLLIVANGPYAIDFAGRSDSQSDLTINDRPDETGILAALGIGSLFEGSEPGTYKVRSEILENPDQLAVSLSGLPGDGRNIAAMASLRDLRFDTLAGHTFTEEMADVTAESGLQVQTSDSQNAQLQAFRQRLEVDRDAVSGVDINEEVLQMMQTQRAYQAAAKLITTADQMLAELFQLVR